MHGIRSLLAGVSLLALSSHSQADVTQIDIHEREMLGEADAQVRYEAIRGLLHFALDPTLAANQIIVDIGLAPRNAQGLVEFSADFELLVPRGAVQSNTLFYYVNNRGGSTLPPEDSLEHPLAQRGYTFLSTGWINELAPGGNRQRLHAPIVGSAQEPVTGMVRYEIITNRAENNVNIAGDNHLAYAPSTLEMAEATLSRRVNQGDPREMIPRDQFSLQTTPVADSNQVLVTLVLNGGLAPGVVYELMYEAKDPVLGGAGLAGIRDAVSLLRHGTPDAAVSAQLGSLSLPEIQHTVSWGNSQSGRLLRQYLYQGFNADSAGRRVFDGVVPVIAGGGFGMFNMRFAMPTRTNGQHENLLYPNDFFPFTYGESTDPFTGMTDGILQRARASNTEPKVMHIQTSNEYWIRGGSLAHTNPEGTADAIIPENVRFYSIGGSQHGSGNGVPSDRATSGQLPANPNMWTPIANTLLVAMAEWVSHDTFPPPSRYPRIADGSLVVSHLDGTTINPDAWHALPGIAHPKAMYHVGYADFGPQFRTAGIIGRHPMSSDRWYGGRVPRVNSDNNDLGQSMVLPPLTAVPLGTFIPWNLRNAATGAETELARLTGGYLPFARSTAQARESQDPRPALDSRYASVQAYLQAYDAALENLIAEGFLLPEYRDTYRALARKNQSVLE